ncbi:MAG: hypothetical protein JJU33_12715 [Phycisphaerales bacterium]|nr:hypothetical protein [Phycisphaerales bacterium]
MHKSVWIGGVIAAGLGLGVAAWLTIGGGGGQRTPAAPIDKATDPEGYWRQKLVSEITVHEIDRSIEQYSIETQRAFADLDREVALLPRWRMEQAERLIALVEGVTREESLVPTPGDPPEAYTRRDVARKAIRMIRHRFSLGAPIDQEAEDRIVRYLLDFTHHPDTSSRFLAMDALLSSTRIIERPEVLARIRKMRAEDPEHGLRRYIQMREFHLQTREGWEGSL